MAQLVTGAVGAVIGYVIGGPTGAYWGWTIGVAVGTVLFPPEGADQVGPQLGDKGVQTSTYGVPIPVVYGTIRTAGNVIWATDIVEVTHVDKSGGKGGPTMSSTTFTYYGNFAVGICEGEADVIRIWANGKLIHDTSGLTLTDVSKPGLNFSLYTGSETQLPDPLIEAHEGVGQVPAHRGLCYIVFDELPLADYGNGIPQLTFEVTRASQAQAYSVPYVTAYGSFNPNMTQLDWTRAISVRIKATTASTSPITEIEFLDLETLTGVSKVLADFPDFDQLTGSIGLTPQSRNLVLKVRAPGPLYYFIEISLDTFTEVSRIVDTAGLTTWVSNPLKKNYSHCGFSVGNYEFIVYRGWATAASILYLSGVGSVGSVFTVDSTSAYVTPMPGSSGEGGFYLTTVPTGATFTVKKAELSVADVAAGEYAFVWTDIATFTVTDVDPGWISLPGIHYVMLDEVDNNLIMVLYKNAGTGEPVRAIKVDVNTGDILWISEGLSISTPFLYSGIPGQSVLQSGRWGWIDDLEQGWELNTATGEVAIVETGYIHTSTNIDQAYNSKAQVIDSNLYLYYLGRKIGLPTTVQVVMDDLTGRAGLAPADVDTSALSALSLPGYMLSRNMQAKAAMEPLASLYLFDVVEVDDVLEFVLRGGSSVGTLIEQDLVVSKNDGGSVSEIRAAETELPAELSISYMDPSIDYNQVTHRARRILNPLPETRSSNKLNLSVAAALDSDFVKSQAMKLLIANWIERVSRTMTASRSFIKYVPSDIITLTLDDGRVIRIRLSSGEIGRDLTYSLFSVEEDSSQYSASAIADSGSGIPGQTIQVTSSLRLILVRSPLLRDQDDIGRGYSKYYYFMGVVGSGSLGVGLLYQSDTGDGYEQIGSVTSEPTWGYAVGSLPDIPFDEKWQQDNTNTLNVVLKNELVTLQSVSFDQLLAGSTNAFALIHSNGDVELMKFQTVVAEANGSFTLSGLLRGRRGTDPFTGGHSGGDVFVMLDAAGSIATTTLSNLGVDKYVKAIPAGTLLENSSELIEANPGNDLKPYAPVWVESDDALWGTDIIMSWVRRTRINGELRNLTGTVPLNEDTEEYEAEIWDGVTLKRTFTGLVTPTFTYTAAQQVTDSWTPTEMSVIVYQISAQVGRGFPSYKTVIQV